MYILLTHTKIVSIVVELVRGKKSLNICYG